MATKIISYRRDIVSYKKFLKAELLRLVFRGDKFVIDGKQNLPGHGMYIYLPTFKSGKLIRVKSRLTKALNQTITDQQILEIEKDIFLWIKDKEQSMPLESL